MESVTAFSFVFVHPINFFSNFSDSKGIILTPRLCNKNYRSRALIPNDNRTCLPCPFIEKIPYSQNV